MLHDQRLLLSTVASFVDAASKTCTSIVGANIFGVASRLQIVAIAVQLEECSKGLRALCSVTSSPEVVEKQTTGEFIPVVPTESDDSFLSEDQEKLLEKIFGADANVEQ